MLADEIRKPSFLALKRFLRDKGLKAHDDPSPNERLSVYPPGKRVIAGAGASRLAIPAPNIYSWSRFTPLGRVRVVIMGQGASTVVSSQSLGSDAVRPVLR